MTALGRAVWSPVWHPYEFVLYSTGPLFLIWRGIANVAKYVIQRIFDVDYVAEQILDSCTCLLAFYLLTLIQKSLQYSELLPNSSSFVQEPESANFGAPRSNRARLPSYPKEANFSV